MLIIKLNNDIKLKGKAVLYINNAAFAFYEGCVAISAEHLQEANCCVLKDVSADGKVYREWSIEKLLLTIQQLDESEVARLEAERDFLQGMRAEHEDMKKAIAQLENNYQETVKALAGEIVKQNKLLQELSKDISAIKNEPLI